MCKLCWRSRIQLISKVETSTEADFDTLEVLCLRLRWHCLSLALFHLQASLDLKSDFLRAEYRALMFSAPVRASLALLTHFVLWGARRLLSRAALLQLLHL